MIFHALHVVHYDLSLSECPKRYVMSSSKLNKTKKETSQTEILLLITLESYLRLIYFINIIFCPLFSVPSILRGKLKLAGVAI